MARVLILSSSQLHKDPRILRQIRALRSDHVLYTCGLSKSNMDGIAIEYPILFRPSKNQSVIKRAKNYLRMKFGEYENLTWDNSVLKAVDIRGYDVIIVNDPREMPLAIALRNSKSTNAKIYFDLHEWYEQIDQNELVNRVFRTLTDKYFSLADQTTTVNNEISELYYNKYGEKPIVVTNAGKYFDIEPTSVLSDSRIRMVHHGVLNASRKLEEMILLMNLLDERFSLDFYLVGSDDLYQKKLINLADPQKIKFLPPVKFDDIVPTLNGYDIGLFILQEDVASYKYALPNKLFEFIQGRLAVAISPNISMKKIVEKYSLGVVGDDFSAGSLANKLNALSTEDINEMKSKSHFAASDLNDDDGVNTIKEIVNSLI